MKLYMVKTATDRTLLTEDKQQALKDFDKKVSSIESKEFDADNSYIKLFEIDLYRFGESVRKNSNISMDDLIEKNAKKIKEKHLTDNPEAFVEYDMTTKTIKKTNQVKFVEMTIFRMNQLTGRNHNTQYLPLDNFLHDFQIPIAFEHEKTQLWIDRIIKDMKDQYEDIELQPKYEGKGNQKNIVGYTLIW